MYVCMYECMGCVCAHVCGCDGVVWLCGCVPIYCLCLLECWHQGERFPIFVMMSVRMSVYRIEGSEP